MPNVTVGERTNLLALGGLVAIGAAGVCLGIQLFTGGWPPCYFASELHFPCPGCGGVRALRALLSGDIASSIRFNPLVVSLAVFAPITFAGELMEARAAARVGSLAFASLLVVAVYVTLARPFLGSDVL